MPYGLFNYGGTINTMGLSPIAPGDPDYVKDPSGIEGNYYGSQTVTRAIPEETGGGEGPIDYRTGQVIPESYVTWALNEDGPNQANPYTLAIPEDAPSRPITTMMNGEEGAPPTTGGTGGCPAGYAPSGASGGVAMSGGGSTGGGGLPDWGAAQRAEIFGTQFNSNPYGLLAGEYLTGGGSGDPFNIHGAGTTWIQTNK